MKAEEEGGKEPHVVAAKSRERFCSASFDNDRVLVSALIAMDENAWTFTIGERVLPAIARSRKWSEELHRRSVLPEAVATEVFLSLTANDCQNLREFRHDCAFSTFLYSKILAAMQTIRRMQGREFPKDLSEYEGDIALTDQKQPSPARIVAAREALEEANRNLAALWGNNPVHALVLILRNCEGLKAKEVAGMLGLTPANVDQINKRAQERFKAFAERSGGHEA